LRKGRLSRYRWEARAGGWPACPSLVVVSRAVFGRFVLAAVLVVLIGLASRYACLRWWPLSLGHTAGLALPGLRIGGVALDPRQPATEQIRARARALLDRRVRLVVAAEGGPRVVVEAPLASLGVSVDVDELVGLVGRLGRTGDLWTRARLADRARRGDLDVPMRPRVDADAVVEMLSPFKEELDRPAVPARLDLEHHAIVPESAGRALDSDGAAAAIARAAADPAASTVELPFAEVQPRISRTLLADVDVSHVLSSFSTYFSRRGDQAPRAQNIEVAASHVDGLVFLPGELVSFNEVVGARSEDNGFQKAFEIYKGEMVEGTGGGTCQVASTLHAAAFFGGLDIVQRLPHSRPSAYIPVGLDATVAYPVVDLKIRNPYSFPVVAHAVVDVNKVTVQLLGADKLARVALVRSVLSTTPFERKVVEDPATTEPRRKQRGADGMKLLRKRVIAMRGGTTRVETTRDTYPPTTEIWKVPPGYDETNLPPLGEDFPDHPSPPPAPTADPEQTLWGE
jgi:vancomycin resistance protein YoaR